MRTKLVIEISKLEHYILSRETMFEIWRKCEIFSALYLCLDLQKENVFSGQTQSLRS